ncbi:hypothetical protein A3E42_03525 [Candidatus Gottesmanbacteria bacterium RIFCSPHIGHO2_12_FULL_40_13]|nr:MAG: hypothetical protein A3E42_03525 [Candidatus Gottesmanbacteria bacterium RIFCSPHIGHO2_12_FULL_40_13]
MQFHKAIRLFTSIIGDELDKYRRMPESELRGWFDILWVFFEKEEEEGRIEYKTWYQKQGDQELSDNPSGEPFYRVKILKLPFVRKDNRRYKPELSRTELIADFFPAGTADIETRRLDMTIFREEGNIYLSPMQFTRFKYNESQGLIKHELRYSEGRELTAFEAKFVKTVFDESIGFTETR